MVGRIRVVQDGRGDIIGTGNDGVVKWDDDDDEDYDDNHDGRMEMEGSGRRDIHKTSIEYVIGFVILYLSH